MYWVTGNVKTLSMHHGYDIQDNNIWKSIVEKKWKVASMFGKVEIRLIGVTTLIIKTLSLCGYEIEMRVIPDEYI